MKIHEVAVYRCGDATDAPGYSCLVTLTLTTARQFTDEEHVVQHGSRWLIGAFLGGLIKAKKLAWKLSAKKGERASKGWA